MTNVNVTPIKIKSTHRPEDLPSTTALRPTSLGPPQSSPTASPIPSPSSGFHSPGSMQSDKIMKLLTQPKSSKKRRSDATTTATTTKNDDDDVDDDDDDNNDDDDRRRRSRTTSEGRKESKEETNDERKARIRAQQKRAEQKNKDLNNQVDHRGNIHLTAMPSRQSLGTVTPTT